MVEIPNALDSIGAGQGRPNPARPLHPKLEILSVGAGQGRPNPARHRRARCLCWRETGPSL